MPSTTKIVAKCFTGINFSVPLKEQLKFKMIKEKGTQKCEELAWKFFQHENQSFPAALSDSGKLHTDQKSQLANILEATVTPPDTRPGCDAVIIDGSSLVYSLPPKTSKTFEEYAALYVVPKFQMYSSNFARTEIVLMFIGLPA